MRRGTRVGQAYVAITADGSGINDDIADSFGRVDYDKYGREHGEHYRSALRKHLEEIDGDLDNVFERSGRKIARALADRDILRKEMFDSVEVALNNGSLDAVVRRAGGRLGDGIGGGIKRAVGEALAESLTNEVRKGRLDAGQIIRNQSFANGDIPLPGPSLEAALRAGEKARKEDERLTRESLQREMKQRLDMLREVSDRAAQSARGRADHEVAVEEEARKRERRQWEDHFRWVAREQEDRVFRRAEEMSKRYIARMVADSKRRFRLDPQFDKEALKRLETELRDFILKRDDLRLKLKTDLPLSEIAKVKAELETLEAKIKVKIDSSGLRGKEAERLVSGNGGGKGGLGGFIGGLLGAGSRNNALNIFGRSIGGLVTLTEKLGKAGADLGKTFSKGFSEAAEGASLFQRVGQGVFESYRTGAEGLGGAFRSIASSGPSAAAAAVVVLVALSALVSVVSALTALVVALAATIASALVGSLLVLGGAIGAAVASVGLLATAFLNMTNAQKTAFSTAFNPLLNSLRGLGQLVLKDIVPAFSTWADNLDRALRIVGPLASVMSGAFARAGNVMTAALSGTGIQQFLDMLGKNLPSITRNMSVAFAAFLNGTASLFAALLPTVNQFAGYLAGITTKFAEWAGSSQGRNVITDFVNRAVSSLVSLWNFATQFFGYIGDLLFSADAQNAGNSIFDSLARSFEGFRTALQEAIRNGDLKRWFQDAIKFGGDLKDAISGLADVFSALNNSGVLAGVGTLFRNFGGFLKALAPVIAPIIDLLGQMAPLLRLLGPLLVIVEAPLILLAGAMAAVATALTWLREQWDNAWPGMKDTVLGVVNAISGALGGFISVLQGVGDWVGRVFGPLFKSSAESAVGGFNQAFIDGAPQARVGGIGLAGSALDGTNSLNPYFAASGATAGANYYNALVPYLNKSMNAARTASGRGQADPSISSALGRSGKASGNSAARYGTVLTFNPVSLPTLPSVNPADFAGTGSGGGSGGGGGGGSKWKNPYVEWANSLIKDGPGIVQQIKNAITSINKSIGAALKDAVKADTLDALRSGLDSTRDAMRSDAKGLVDAAQSELNSAAQRLAGATTKKEARAALKQVKRAQANLQKAKAARARIRAAEAILKAQEKITESGVTKAGRAIGNLDISKATKDDVDKIRKGLNFQNATLADFAKAREKVADALDKAKDRLADAIALRDDFKQQVSDGIKSFGSILTAIAQDGKDLSSTDITSNLQDRLDQIRKFRDDLNRLLTMGLSQDAYKQLVEAGVEQGGAFASALAQGGAGAIADVNGLVSSINAEADALGLDASNRLYQAGVDAAQGLVDGLNSLSADLESAATKLGNTIARAVKDALGIKSPSKVAIGLMGYWGDGLVGGLDQQHGRVGTASARLASQVAVAPGRAATGTILSGPVSGNRGGSVHTHEWNITTPTTDPVAVAREMMNEMTGRIG